jgi:hypothetical protein
MMIIVQMHQMMVVRYKRIVITMYKIEAQKMSGLMVLS